MTPAMNTCKIGELEESEYGGSELRKIGESGNGSKFMKPSFQSLSASDLKCCQNRRSGSLGLPVLEDCP